jgi:hypothetical protein
MAISVRIPCPKCGVSNEVPKHYCGKSVRCSGCGDFFTAQAPRLSDILFNCPACDQSIEAPPDLAGQLVVCPSCQKTIEVPVLGRVTKANANPPPRSPERGGGQATVSGIKSQAGATYHKQMAGLIGSTLLFVGVFCPIVTVPIVGQMNYFQNGDGDGRFVLVLAAASAILTIARKFPLMWLTGGGSLGLVAYTFISFQSALNERKQQMQTELEGNPFAGLAQLAVQSVQIQWGFAVLVLGAILVIAAAAMRTNNSGRS